jgi:sugar phosphate isomerase/epimerase
MKLAINGQQLSATHTLPQVLDVLDGLGVKAIELWPNNIPHVLGTRRDATREENERYETRDVDAAAALLKARGFTVACVTLGFHAAPVCFARGGGEAFTQALQGAVDAAVRLGAGLVNCYNVGIPLSIWGDAVAPAAAYAAACGVVITLENEAHDESGLPRNVAAVCERVASPGFGTQYDPCNYYHAGVEPFPTAYEAIKQHIRYVHLKGGCHYDPALAGVHKGSTMRDSARDFIGYVPLPEAAFPVEAIVRRLNRDGYDGWVTLEPHVKGEHILAFYDIEVPYLRGLLAQ